MPAKKIKFKNRESWLHFITEELRPKFEHVGYPLPEKIRISIGFTSKGGKKTIGQCWDSSCSSDRHFEIFIVPWLNSPSGELELEVAAVQVHELIHASVGLKERHGKIFKTVAHAFGLEGKMDSTVPGTLFKEIIGPILEKAGAFPHGVLDVGYKSTPADGGVGGETLTDAPPSQTNRYIKCVCNECGYSARTTRRWIIDIGAPFCPHHGEMEADKEALDKFNEAEDIRNAKKAKRFEEKPFKDPGTRNSKKDIKPEELPDTGPLVINPLTPTIAEREAWRAGGGDIAHHFDIQAIDTQESNGYQSI